MSTGAIRAKLDESKKLWSKDQINEGFYEYLLEQIASIRAQEWGTYSPLTSDLADTFTITTPCRGKSRNGYLFNLPVSLAEDIPFENLSGVNYYVGLKYAAIPEQVESNVRLGGVVQYRYLKDYIGELAHPNAVTDMGGGQLKFKINSVTESGVDHSGRTCQVWLDTPLSLSDWIDDGTSVYTSPDNFVTINSYLGQGTPSTNPNDYWVFVPGPSWKKNTDLRQAYEYLPLGVVTGSGTGTIPTVFDNTIQLRPLDLEIIVEDDLPFEEGDYTAERIRSNSVSWNGNLIVHTQFQYNYDIYTPPPIDYFYWRLWKFDGMEWTKIRELDYPTVDNAVIYNMGSYGDKLMTIERWYADSDASLWEYNGTAWTKKYTWSDMGIPSSFLGGPVEYRGVLHMCRRYNVNTLRCYRWNGTTMAYTDVGVEVNIDYREMIIAQNRLWFCPYNHPSNAARYVWWNGTTYGNSSTEDGWVDNTRGPYDGDQSGLGRDDLVTGSYVGVMSYDQEIRNPSGSWIRRDGGFAGMYPIWALKHVRDRLFFAQYLTSPLILHIGARDFEFNTIATVFTYGDVDNEYIGGGRFVKSSLMGGVFWFVCDINNKKYVYVEDPLNPGTWIWLSSVQPVVIRFRYNPIP